MKKLYLSILLCIIFITDNTYAQITALANTSVNSTTDYVGWASTVANPLRIKHEGNYGIEFYTNTGAGTFGTAKMLLKNSGELGIGTTSPASWLSVSATGTGEAFRTSVPSGYDSFWKILQGTTEYARFVHFNSGSAFYIYASRGALKLSSGNSSGTNFSAFQILGGSTNPGFVGLGDFTLFNPSRQLDVYDASNPQLRLSYDAGSPGSPAGSTIYTDFQQLSTGDLNINPMNASTPAGVGIGTTTLINNEKLSVNAYVPPSATDVQAAEINSIQNSNVANNKGLVINAEGGTADIHALEINMSNSYRGSPGGIFVSNSSVSTDFGDAYGISANVIGASNTSNVGMYATGTYASDANMGIVAEGGTPLAYTANNYGVAAAASYGNNSYGVLSNALYGATETNGVVGSGYYGAIESTGVFGYATSSATNYGVFGTTLPIGSSVDWAGFFSGNTFVAALFTPSDSTLKKNINPLLNATSILKSLHPKSFEFDNTRIPQLNVQSGIHYGVIAQELEQILPGLVTKAIEPAVYDTLHVLIHPSGDFKSVNYTELIPFLIQGFKEQQAQIDSLIALNNAVTPRVTNPKTNPTGTAQRIELSNNQGIILNQNDPNPFAESTSISYYIPEAIKEAKIIFSDNKGSVLPTAKIDSRGDGTLEVYASELSSGIYTYTLICDGKVVESKKMMKN